MSSLEKLEALAKAATPGEWIARKRGVSVACGLPNDEVTYPVASCKNDISERHEQLADAAYIAAANPQAILSLLAEHRQLIERVEVLEGALRNGISETEGLMADYEGVTDNAQDAGRFVQWDDGILSERFDWVDEARKAFGADS